MTLQSSAANPGLRVMTDYPVERRSGSARRFERTGLLCLPAVIYMLVGFVLPLGIMASYSVTNPSLSLSNYDTLFQESLYRILLWNTVRITALVVIATLLIAYPYAYLMSRLHGMKLAIMALAVLLPFLSSTVVRAFTWLTLLSPNGPIPGMLRTLGLSHPPTLVGNSFSVVVGLAQVCMPFLVFPIYSALTLVSDDYLRAAASMGAGPLVAFRRITLPLTKPGIVVGCLLVAVYAMGGYVTPELLGGQGSVILNQDIVTQIQTVVGFGPASAVGVGLLLLSAVCVLFAAKLVGSRSVFGA